MKTMDDFPHVWIARRLAHNDRAARQVMRLRTLIRYELQTGGRPMKGRKRSAYDRARWLFGLRGGLADVCAQMAEMVETIMTERKGVAA